MSRFLIPRHLKIERDADGRPLCKLCRAAPIPRGRRCYCSTECSEEALVRSNGGYARQKVFERDKGVCALCGLDAGVLERVIRHLERKRWTRDTHEMWRQTIGVVRNVAAATNWSQHLWEADHVKAVSEGGGGSGLANLRTLCRRCHAKESGLLRRRLNAARRGEEGKA